LTAAPEDFDRVGDLLGDFCEAAAEPAPQSAQPGDRQRGAGTGVRRAPGEINRALAVLWPEIVGAEVAANASPAQLKAARLVVSTSSSVWAHTLQCMGEDLMARLNQRLGPGTVQQIAFRHAGWEERQRGETADGATRGNASPMQLSREQVEAVGQLENLDLPPEIRDRIARAMRASFVRGQQGPVR
jgi:hypothetical protein